MKVANACVWLVGGLVLLGCTRKSADVTPTSAPELNVDSDSLDVATAQVATKVANNAESPLRFVGKAKAFAIPKAIEPKILHNLDTGEGIPVGGKFSPDGQRLYLGDEKDGIVVFDGKTFEQLQKWPVSDKELQWNNAVALSRDGSMIAAIAKDASIHVFDTATGDRRCVFTGHQEEVPGLALNPKGDVAVSGGADPDEWTEHNRSTYIAWNAGNGEKLWATETRWRDPKPVTFTPDGQHVVLIGKSGTFIDFCDLDKGVVHRSLHFASEVKAPTFEFSPDGEKLLLEASSEYPDDKCYLALVSVAKFEPLWVIDTGAQFAGNAQFSADGAMIVATEQTESSSHADIVFRSAIDGSPLVRISGANRAWRHLTISPDGTTILADDKVLDVAAAIGETSPTK